MKQKKSKWARVPLYVVGALLGAYLILYAVNYGCSLALRAYIRSFAPVVYDESRAVPVYDETLGHYTVTAGDGELKLMMLSDIHIGGGCCSLQKDKKTVYEVITMLQAEKPDLVILGGDNTFAVPGPVFNGGGTLDNAMAARDLLAIFEQTGVYFTTVFGNHDTEAFGYADRAAIGKLYESEKYPHCIFKSEFSDPESNRPSVSNQILVVKNTDGSIGKLLLLMDTNDYIDGSLAATINWRYDVIHPAQTQWAKDEVLRLSAANGGDTLKTLCFYHIPTGEYETAYRELSANGFRSTTDSEYVEGIWDEKIDEAMGGRIWYGGCHRTGEEPNALDDFFETLGPEGIHALEACFCGHDHVNDAAVRYRGVLLAYNESVDNNAYTGIAESGYQRGCTVFTLADGGAWTYERKNVYRDCGADANLFADVRYDTPMYPGWAPEG